jgi:hypothetical protein
LKEKLLKIDFMKAETEAYIQHVEPRKHVHGGENWSSLRESEGNGEYTDTNYVVYAKAAKL